MEKVIVVGAGLAGCEAAWQLAQRGIEVELYEMKPARMQDANSLKDYYAELVCSNSLRSDRPQNAVGLLKKEMRELGSLIMECADATAVPAGGALAVDREGFSKLVTQRINSHINIQVVHNELTKIPYNRICFVATGPQTDGAMAEELKALMSESEELYFYDAVAPIVYAESVDMQKAFESSRYERGSDYINCPLDRDEYYAFVDALVSAEVAPVHGEETNLKVFEGCLPVEVIASRGRDTLRYGPLKAVGLTDPHTNRQPYAVVQLRHDDAEGRFYNLVGFQTRLKHPEQKRVFSMIPALANARYMRYGVMHKSTFINGPKLLNGDYSLRQKDNIYIIGQLSGVEGYVESAASGLLAGIQCSRKLSGHEALDFTAGTAIGALSEYVSRGMGGKFVPMNINFGIMKEPKAGYRSKAAKTEAYIEESEFIIKSIREGSYGDDKV